MPRESSTQLAKNVWSILEASKSSAYIGEPISQFEHAVQAADRALNTGSIDEVVLAALLHDIGHLVDPNAEQMDKLGTANHERLGAKFLSDLGFSTHVTDLVAAHVDAKRYLCSHHASYYEKLSPASRSTLEWQGGPMDYHEAERFESDPLFEKILALRVYDERAKLTDCDVPDLESYRVMIRRNISQTLQGETTDAQHPA